MLFIDPKPFFSQKEQKYNYHVVGTSLEKLFDPFQDLFTPDINKIYIDDKQLYNRIHNYVKEINPELQRKKILLLMKK